ncbi:orotidine-5'-phosphate decarboxylase [Aliidiomarina maris]|uniref:Orotidine 5'-phosphate decarboxylase n=1 Tax=Aliidiomarina maris TaxID=531312 RepID=A0A327WZC2_9GAMM|nr:orotidine-5'-phosphate decarboxylase [Aliidiomarina maris]MBA3989193.1 orotidine-5'-phosphate decarboxylase [Idiomarina sp.]MCL5050385.1 orotidine-5'-phosphate decarboxylase [Bacillota bacterium]RAJ98859.1 orotidine-5'-phosphate decarboxylase [Aliidiomarina maris]RUO25006.1 orotidine-5'-phosphate decarboxylase [Aliidiomarina maris]
MKKVIVALDYADAAEALAFAHQLDPQLCRVKVGKELFTSAGPDLVRELHALNFDVFLDLKFHDIPATTAKAVAAAAELGVWMVNVHASGGEAMLQAAKQALEPYGAKAPKLIAVTVLTSMSQDDLEAVGIDKPLTAQVLTLAQLAKQCGLDGVVCSAKEAHLLRESLGADFLLVTPGIRPAGSEQHDQKRVMTPEEAIRAGVSYLVMGRPIRDAQSPNDVLKKIQQNLH